MKMRLGSLILLLSLILTGSAKQIEAQDDTPIDDKDIKVLHFEELSYPSLANAARIEGVVVVRVSLDNQGNVLAASAISGTGILIEYSIANVRKWKFQPNARKMAVIVYHFTLAPADCGPDRNFFMLQGNFATVTSCVMTVQPER